MPAYFTPKKTIAISIKRFASPSLAPGINSGGNNDSIKKVISAKADNIAVSVILKVDVTFKLSKVLDGGTCYPYKLYYESPLTFESQTLSCRDPYSDSQSYGYLLGSLYEFLPMLYEKNK